MDWDPGIWRTTPVRLRWPSTGLWEWWRQWWSSLLFSGKPESMQHYAESKSFKAPELHHMGKRAASFLNENIFGMDMQSFLFWCMCAASIFGVWAKAVFFESDSLDCTLSSFRRCLAVRSAAWYDFNQQIEEGGYRLIRGRLAPIEECFSTGRITMILLHFSLL